MQSEIIFSKIIFRNKELQHLVYLLGSYIFFLSGFFPCQGQVPGYYFHHLGTADGLSQASNAYVYRDSRGFIWISSIDGLNRYDGLEVRKYRPQKNQSKSINGQLINSAFFEEENGNIWFCTYQAINRYNRLSDDFDSWQIRDFITKDTLKEDYSALFLDPKGQLWVQIGDNQNGQLYFFDTSHFSYKRIGPLLGNRFAVDYRATPDQFSAIVYSFFYSRNAPLYRTEVVAEGIRNTELYFDGTTFPKVVINDLLLEKDTIWMAGNFGVASFVPNQNIWSPVHLAHNDITALSLAFLDSNRLAITTRGEGLYFFDLRESRVRVNFRYKAEKSSSVSGNTLNDIYLDPANTLWISDWNAGLNFLHLDKPKVENIILSDLINEPSVIIRSMIEDRQQNIWCATTESGIIIFKKDGGIKRYKSIAGLPKTSIYQLFTSQEGIVFAATLDGLFWYDESKLWFHKVKSEDIDFEIVGQAGRFSEDKLIFHNLKTYEIIKDSVDHGYRLEQSDNFPALANQYVDYWYQMSSGDILCNINSSKTVKISPTGKVDTLDAAIQNLKGCWEPLHEDTIWLATTYGLIKMSKSTGAYTIFDESNGLPNQYLYSVVSDNSGYLWLSTNLGIIRFNTKTYQSQHLRLSDGIWENEFYTNARLATSSGEIWFGNMDVINVIKPTNFKNVETVPQIQITELLVNDHIWEDTLYIGECEKLQFPFNKNTLSFKFVALEYSDPNYNQLWYRLDGYDSTGVWIPARLGAPGFARYAKIPSGKYTFQIKAANSDGIETPVSYELKISILKPFYFQMWFIILMTTISVGIIYGIYQNRLARLRKELLLKQKTIESEMRALRAQMSPHFLFNSLNSIQAIVLRNENEKAGDALEHFAGLMRQILDNSAEETINLETEIVFLEAYLETESLRWGDKLKWVIEIGEDIDIFETKIPSMVLQPHVENAILHGITHKPTGGTISINIGKEAKVLCCIIEDDGIGREAAQKFKNQKLGNQESKGRKITLERLYLYDQKNGTHSAQETIDLKDQEGCPLGTRVVLKIGLNV